MDSVYVECPSFDTQQFFIRLVRIADAPDLLCCYSDLKAAQLFNCDRCTSNFIFSTLSEMEDCIRFWLKEYEKSYYVRFAIVDKRNGKAAGTIEIFNEGTVGSLQNVGILRLDICSAYENERDLNELIGCATERFYKIFGLEYMITKAVPGAKTRIKVLEYNGFLPGNSALSGQFKDYYIRNGTNINQL